jgi:cysteine desulfurase
MTPVYLDNNATTPVDPAVSGRQLLQVCPGMLASNGSACHVDSEAPSVTLLALGFSRDQALGSVRLSLGRHTTAADIGMAADVLTDAWRALSMPARAAE